MVDQRGFFDVDHRLEELSAHGDPLERVSVSVDFEIFRPTLEGVLARSDRAKGGRPPMDPVMMLKVLILQSLYGLSDQQAEFQIKDRLSFQRFLGLTLTGKVPDYSTVWRFREALVEADALQALFDRFDAALREKGYLAMLAARLGLEDALVQQVHREVAAVEESA